MLTSFRDVSFEWPNGQVVFQHLSFSLDRRKYGLVGPNGAGKSTLARLLSGELSDFSGEIRSTKDFVFFTQNAPPPDRIVAEVVADVWENTEAAELLSGIPLELSCRSLSGGQWTRVRLALVIATGKPFLILDEPTNHLDLDGRDRILDFVRRYDGGLLLISHDRELLREADEILELSSQGLQKYGGNWDFYEAERSAERTRVTDALSSAKLARDRAKEERADRAVRRDRQNRHGKINAEKKGLPKIILGGMKSRSEVTTGKINAESGAKLDSAVSEAHQAAEKLKVDEILHLELPEIQIPETEIIFFLDGFSYGYPDPLWSPPLSLTVRGPRKVAFTGSNGTGKSTLLRLLAGHELAGTANGELYRTQKPMSFVTQSQNDLDENRTVLENIREVSEMSEMDLRNALARFLFRGDRVFQRVSELSGGEKLRLALARALLRPEAAAILLLDEPTNHLDLFNVEFLEEFLRHYPGAVLIASHDREFLKRVGVDVEIQLRK